MGSESGPEPARQQGLGVRVLSPQLSQASSGQGTASQSSVLDTQQSVAGSALGSTGSKLSEGSGSGAGGRSIHAQGSGQQSPSLDTQPSVAGSCVGGSTGSTSSDRRGDGGGLGDALSGNGGHSGGGTQGRRCVGFMVLDPMYENGRLVGYYRNVVRTLDTAHSGTVSLMTKVGGWLQGPARDATIRVAAPTAR